jgi:pyocin large subunit-like protein
MPFANAHERAIHFAKHGHEFGASSEIDYERMADAFMSRPMTMTMRECIRPNGTRRLRVNVANDHFGVAVVSANTVVTYYVIPFHRKHRRGGIVPFFADECSRNDL